MQPSPLISVIIPVYQVKDYLADCLNSLLGQCFDAFEMIAVDDGSTDGSAAVLADFAQQDARVSVLTQPNRGVAAARRAGLEAARGETVLFVDADDVLDAHYLQEMWQTYQTTSARLVVSPLVRFTQHPQRPQTLPDLFSAGCLAGAQRVRLFDDFSAAMALCGKLVARSAISQLPLPQARTGDDIVPSVFLLSLLDPVAPAPRAFYFYRVREGSQSRAGEGRFEGLLNGFCQARQLLKQHQTYASFAPGFEYVCRVVLTSFMEKYGLTPQEEKALAARRNELQVPLALFRKRNFRFRVRQVILQGCLKYNFSYAVVMRVLRRLAHRPQETL